LQLAAQVSPLLGALDTFVNTIYGMKFALCTTPKWSSLISYTMSFRWFAVQPGDVSLNRWPEPNVATCLVVVKKIKKKKGTDIFRKTLDFISAQRCRIIIHYIPSLKKKYDLWFMSVVDSFDSSDA
jgi:hypothetical protein